MDAGAFGCRLGPRDAYRFARGEEITASTGQPAKLSRPLDFLVVADHPDRFGFFPQLMSGARSAARHKSFQRALVKTGIWRIHRTPLFTATGARGPYRPGRQFRTSLRGNALQGQ
jgi:uncharacterized protein DUF3604